MAIDDQRVSSLLHDLPTLYQTESTPSFLGRFLLAFEHVLLGVGEISDTSPAGLEEILGGSTDTTTGKQVLNGVQRYFDPGVRMGLQDGITTFQFLTPAESAPPEFLPWLASWVALVLRQDWDDKEKRRFISRIVPLYQLRGTPAGMAEILRAYTGMGVEVNELISAFQVGAEGSRLGINTVIEGGPPHYFFVKLFLESPDPALKERKEQIARAIIEQEKPAHTDYDLKIEVPIMQIEVHSTVGVDTLLGIP